MRKSWVKMRKGWVEMRKDWVKMGYDMHETKKSGCKMSECETLARGHL